MSIRYGFNPTGAFVVIDDASDWWAVAYPTSDYERRPERSGGNCLLDGGRDRERQAHFGSAVAALSKGAERAACRAVALCNGCSAMKAQGHPQRDRRGEPRARNHPRSWEGSFRQPKPLLPTPRGCGVTTDRPSARRWPTFAGMAGEGLALLPGNGLARRSCPYPHAELHAMTNGRKKQAARLIKCECAECGHVARVARQWIDDQGAPHFPSHGEMTMA